MTESNNIETQPVVLVNSVLPPSVVLAASNLGQALSCSMIKETSYSPIFQEQAECSNRYNHISAFPGFGRVICPTCRKVYIRRSS